MSCLLVNHWKSSRSPKTRKMLFGSPLFQIMRSEALIPHRPFIPIITTYEIVISVQFSCSVMSDSLQPHGLRHARFHCPSPSPKVCSNSCPSSQCYHSTISSSVNPFSSCLLSFPASGSFPVSQFFTSWGQSIGVSASTSVLPMNIQY